MTDEDAAGGGDGPTGPDGGPPRWPPPETWASRGEIERHADPGHQVGTLDHDEGPWVEEAPSWRHDARPAADRMSVPFSWTDGVALIVWFFLANVVVGIAFALAGVNLLEPDGMMIATFAVVTFLTVLAGAYGWLRTRGAWSWHLAGPVRPAVHHLWTGIGAGIVGWLGFTTAVAAVIAVVDPEEMPGQETLEGLAGADGVGLILALLGVVVLAALVEELVYRGVFFQALRGRIGLVAAILVSSLAFGFMHFELVLGGTTGFVPAGVVPMAGIALIGGWFAWLLHRTGSLVVPIAAHATFNAIAFALAVAAA